MRRYKIVACVLLILSVFDFVLAAPVAIREVREACTDAVDRGENVIIGPGKRAEEEKPLTQSGEQQQKASSYWSSTRWQRQRSSSAPNYASGTHRNPSFSSRNNQPLLSTTGWIGVPWNPLAEGEATPIHLKQKPPLLSTSGGMEVPWNPLVEGEATPIHPKPKPPLLSTSGGMEVPWNPKAEGEATSIYPKPKPPLLSTSGGMEVPWSPKAEGEATSIYPKPKPPLLSTSGGMEVPWNPKAEGEATSIYPKPKPPLLSTSGGTEVPWNPKAEGEATPIQPTSSSKTKSVSWAPTKKVLLPSGEIHHEVLPEDKPLPLSPGKEGYQPKIAAQKSPSPSQPKPQSKNMLKQLVGKLKFKFYRRISGTADGVL